MTYALVIGDEQKEQIQQLREKAASAPVDMLRLPAAMQDPEARAAHRARMTEQTIQLPVGFIVCFSIEINHPAGMARHLSVSFRDGIRAPHPAVIAMIAQEFGFSGSLRDWVVYPEKFSKGGGFAVNIVQVIDPAEDAKLQLAEVDPVLDAIRLMSEVNQKMSSRKSKPEC